MPPVLDSGLFADPRFLQELVGQPVHVALADINQDPLDSPRILAGILIVADHQNQSLFLLVPKAEPVHRLAEATQLPSSETHSLVLVMGHAIRSIEVDEYSDHPAIPLEHISAFIRRIADPPFCPGKRFETEAQARDSLLLFLQKSNIPCRLAADSTRISVLNGAVLIGSPYLSSCVQSANEILLSQVVDAVERWQAIPSHPADLADKSPGS
ncbi:uncharacterized protein BJ171DRAFT_503967 [Polychytrium aggregatum]|uniref:uncharacterized protein n=1 Tax=Polychytrium aggregatum TaxID=110093 RepID=UPI0022FE2B70|nr:uncharacterized protein BJ171DRAFT_503967 [Polychytrium aggregatum]KAI9204893.1 hypothetical protein BJ171DRAFT_503967 [Polychytrium aggregatum]